MRYEELIDHYGGLTKAAEALDVAKQTIHSWKGRGSIPFDAQFYIQIKTKGRLKLSLSDLTYLKRSA
jgi:hypothetical protein